jgi:hypothetical protein
MILARHYSNDGCPKVSANGHRSIQAKPCRFKHLICM